MNIRLLAAQDLPALLSLYQHLHVADDALPSPDQVNAVWAEIMSTEKISYFGAFVDTDLVSSCTITVIPNLTRGCRPYGVIENVVTHADRRGRGHGTATLRAALAHGWSAGCYKVMLLTGRNDPAIMRFYESAGFSPHGKQAFVAKPPI